MKLIERSLEVIHIDEPELSFGHGQTCDHPKDGLFLYGPHSAPARSREVSVGVIGTKDGLFYFRNWAIALGGFVAVPPPKKTDKENRLHLSNFPGLEEAFGIIVNPGEFVERKVDAKALDDTTRTLNQHEAVRKAVDLYLNEIERYDNNEEQTVDVWIFILPEIIFERCRPLARRSGLDLTKGEFAKSKKEKTDLPLLRDVIDQSAEDIFNDVPDFHRQVKARLLKLGHTSQLIRETTLVPDKFLNRAGYPIRGLQDPATVAWNLATGLYYKTQPEPPWKLAHVRPGVCYIGLVFKMIPNDPREHACCAAQMFLNEGDAVVFRGANGPWKTGDFEFHLKAPEAKRLIAKVLDTFKEKHGEPPKEFFIHGRTTFNDDEWNAFKEAAPKGPSSPPLGDGEMLCTLIDIPDPRNSHPRSSDLLTDSPKWGIICTLLQDIFILVHRLCATFDSSKGSARFWILQMTCRRAISRRRYLTSRHLYPRVDLDDVETELADPRNPAAEIEDSTSARIESRNLRKVFDCPYRALPQVKTMRACRRTPHRCLRD